jgi:acyl-CoA thioesterase
MEKKMTGDSVLTSVFSRIADKGFAVKLGLKLIELTPGHAIVEMTPGKDSADIFGTVHGGAIFSLMNEAFQMACNSHGTVAVALSVNVVYHKPAQWGQKLRAESREIHRSQKIATYNIWVRDERNVLIASCQAIAHRKKEQWPFLGGGT